MNSSPSNRTSTSSTTSTYSPEQTALQSTALSSLSSALTNPGSSPLEAAGVDQINKGYSGMVDQMNRELASRGFTASGTTGTNMEQLGESRLGAIGSYEGSLQSNILTDALSAAYKPTGSSSVSVAPGSTTAGATSGGLAALLGSVNQGIAAAGKGGGG
jgi:hypothetical protein